MDIYLLIFMLIILIGSVVVYTYYLKEKKDELDSIKRGFCPSCHHQSSIEIIDERSTGCGSPKMVTFECSTCGYTNVFNISGGSCCI